MEKEHLNQEVNRGEFPSFPGAESPLKREQSFPKPDQGQEISNEEEVGGVSVGQEQGQQAVEPTQKETQPEPSVEKNDESLSEGLIHQSADTSGEASFLNDLVTGETPQEKLNSIL